MLLVDASVWVPLAVPEEHSQGALSLVESKQVMAALDLTLLEVANVLGARMGAAARARWLADVIVRRCDRRLLRIDLGLTESALEIASDHGISAYGAAYVAAAQRHGWQLVSIDHRELVSKGLAVTPDAALYP